MGLIGKAKAKAFGFASEFTAAITEAAVNPAVETKIVSEKQRLDLATTAAMAKSMLNAASGEKEKQG